MDDDADLRAAWDAAADAWIAWARRPGFDSYWQFHRDLFLPLLPPPGLRTLDLGCGEGRLTRDLAARGHRVVAVDGSPRLVEAARAAAPELEYHVADAASLPLADGSVDLVVAHLSLQDVDDLDGAVGECARVLVGGGRLWIAIVHPLNSAGAFTSHDPESPYVIAGSYLSEFRYADEVERDGLAMTFSSMHRTLERYVTALASAGFVIDHLREPAVPAYAVTTPAARRWTRVPLFLHLGARLLDAPARGAGDDRACGLVVDRDREEAVEGAGTRRISQGASRASST